MITTCTFSDTGGACGPIAARLRVDLVGLGEYTATEPVLCFRHLNRWLDRADAGRMPEPMALAFVDPCPSDVATWWSVDPDAVNEWPTSFGPPRRRYYLNRGVISRA